VALQDLGYQVHGDYLGLRILGLNPDSPNLDRLRPNDLIVELGGEKLPSMETFKSQLGHRAPGQTVSAVIRRDGSNESTELKLIKVRGRTRIGAVLRPEFASIALPVKVSFRDANTSGASAGLVFALEIFDELSEKDVARGRVIAATGTLDASGTVGPIEGLSLKLVAAERAGATVFLVPRENWPEIKNHPTTMKVIPVETFQEALHALE
jgi:PDZ domain-containing protein